MSSELVALPSEWWRLVLHATRLNGAGEWLKRRTCCYAFKTKDGISSRVRIPRMSLFRGAFTVTILDLVIAKRARTILNLVNFTSRS